MTTCFVGADIAADTVTVVWQTRRRQFSDPLVIDQTPAGFAHLRRQLRRQATPEQTWVVMEATGSYWMALASHLDQHGVIVSVVNPLHAHHFAQAQGGRSKTDAIDARSLSELGQVLQLPRWSPPPAICEQLEQRLTERDQLVQTRSRWKNQLRALRRRPDADATIVARWQQRLAALTTEIDALDAELKTLLLGPHEWHDSARRLLQIKGFGIIAAAWLLVATHNFAHCQTAEQVAAYAGLAPHPHESGKSVRGKRQTGHGGHAALRRTLYMAAGSALQHNPPLRDFYQRLVARGKIKNVARVAVARKLAVLGWAVVTKERDFDPNYRQSALAA